MISSAFALKERGRGTKGKSLQSRLVPLRGGGSKKRETIIAFPFFVFLSLRARRFYQLSLSLSLRQPKTSEELLSMMRP